MMQCRDIDENMVDFLYQELDATKAAEFQAHVDGCARCGTEVTSLTRTRQALHALPEAEPSPAVTTRLLHEAAKRAAPAGGGILDFFSRLLKPVMLHPAWAAAATVLLVVGAATLLSTRAKVSPTAQRAPESSVAAAPPPAPVRVEDNETTTRELGRGEAAAADKPRELRPDGYRADDTAPKVPAPAVAAAPPAEPSAVTEGDRRGRTASLDEAKNVEKVRAEAAHKKAAAPPADYKGLPGTDFDDNAATGGLAKQDLRRPQSGMLQAKPSPPPAPTPQPQPQKEAEVAESPAQGLANAPVNTKSANAQAANAAANQPPAGAGGPSPANGYGNSNKDEARDDRLAVADKPASPPPPPQAAPPAAAAPAPAPTSPSRQQAEGQKQVASEPAPQEEQKVAGPTVEQLLAQAKQAASDGRCGEAQKLSAQIASADPEFHRKRVASDPTLNSCTTAQQQQRASKAKAASPKRPAATEQQQQQQSDKALSK
jgi:hypothetical protein